MTRSIGGASERWVTVQTPASRVALDPELGNIRTLEFDVDGRRIAPLHEAPWAATEADDAADTAPPDQKSAAQRTQDNALRGDADTGEPRAANGGQQHDATAAVPPIEQQLAGDFFCAPFGANDIDPADPMHGWTANSAWTPRRVEGNIMHLTLDRRVMGAEITKSLHLADDAPLLYQTHTITGGSGGLTVAHHPMVSVAGGARLSCSAKRAVLVPDVPLEPGRHALRPGARGRSLSDVPGMSGQPVDLTRLPIAQAHEDFVTLVEAPGAGLGWTALVRTALDDVVFVLKDPAVLPVTMLWHSNGGRNYPPWNGRHRDVLGIEDGCAAGADGFRAALGDNPVSAEGVATALRLSPKRTHRVAHVIGALPRPAGWNRVTDITLTGDRLDLAGDAGQTVTLPFARDVFFGVQN